MRGSVAAPAPRRPSRESLLHGRVHGDGRVENIDEGIPSPVLECDDTIPGQPSESEGMAIGRLAIPLLHVYFRRSPNRPCPAAIVYRPCGTDERESRGSNTRPRVHGASPGGTRRCAGRTTSRRGDRGGPISPAQESFQRASPLPIPGGRHAGTGRGPQTCGTPVLSLSLDIGRACGPRA